ncbi:TPA: phosphate propanoyltransferase [bacterium]|nr:phosphate propanoyltransferase [bacterium]
MSKKIVVETSARHIHLSEEDLAKLFGEGYKLTPKKELSQPGQFACEERLTVVGPKREIPNVIILGPTRAKTQVEVSATDARTLGLNPPVRESGDVEGSAPCVLRGPKGEIELKEGVIIAKRHIHVTPEDAVELGVKDRDIVGLKVETPNRSLIFGDVVVRVSEKFATYVHLDTDEANAAGISGTVYGEIVKFD